MRDDQKTGKVKHPIFSFIDTILQLYTNFKPILAKTVIFVDYDGRLCLFSYVDRMGGERTVPYHFQLFDNILGIERDRNTRYRPCKFSFMERPVGNWHLLGAFFVQVNDYACVAPVPFPSPFCVFLLFPIPFRQGRIPSLGAPHNTQRTVSLC